MKKITPRTQGAHFVSGEVHMRANHLTKPRNYYGKERYSTTFSFSCFDDDTYHKILEAMNAAYESEKWKFLEDGAETEITFDELSKPIRTDDTFKDMYFIRCTSAEKPGLVDRNLNKIEIEPVSGCSGRVSISFHCNYADGKKLIYPVLENVQIINNHAERMYKVEDDFCALV